MRTPVPAYIETLQPYIPGKPIEETQREYGLSDVIKLASNENPLGPSLKAVHALQESLSKLHLYPDGSSFNLKRRIAEHLGVDPAAVVPGSGSNEIIELLVRTFMGGDDEALLCQGSFAMYKVTLHAHGRRFLEVPMKDGHYDLEAMAASIGPKTRLVFVANPDNPTGTWFGRAPFERFLETARAKNPEALLVIDEAYFEYVTEADYPNSLVYHRDYPNLVTLRTFSKIYGLAGLRLGYGVMAPALASYLNRTRMPFNVTSSAPAGGLAALDDADHVVKSRELNAQGLVYVQQELKKLGVKVLPSQANFVFVDLGRPATPVYEGMLRKGVITRPIPNYGFPNALRISTGLMADNQRMVAALREVLKVP
ncbi:MAG: histidinol-phosphate transaminase [Deltaproteobacteria bacterium]|nr:histidinol-phosphate transaminase [Deltaproteobacteria bacterium]